MNPFVFENATKVFFGENCVRSYLPGLLEEYGPNVLLAYGGGSIKKNGVYGTVTDILRASGKHVTEFSGIMPNPTYTKMLEEAELIRRRRIDLVLAVGGGSVMDCSKAAALAARYPGDVWERFWASSGIVDFEPVPLGVIVTASGTGSECNGGAVITHEEQRIKTDRDYPRCNPRFALLDPAYTYSVSRRQLAAGGFDILSHIMETYFSPPDEENVSDDISEALMRGVIRDLRASIRNPLDANARSNLMWEASMAENRIIKLGKRLDFQCHQIEHQLSAYTNCAHGEGLAVLHPAYYRRICLDGAAKFARFAVRVWGLSREGRNREDLALAGVEALASFIRELGLPTTLRELGLTDRAVLELVADSSNLNAGGYRQLTREEVLDILDACW